MLFHPLDCCSNWCAACRTQAVRHGHWIVLDELNLAPSDVLEALNRLLDDNRELYVPELQQTVRISPRVARGSFREAGGVRVRKAEILERRSFWGAPLGVPSGGATRPARGATPRPPPASVTQKSTTGLTRAALSRGSRGPGRVGFGRVLGEGITSIPETADVPTSESIFPIAQIRPHPHFMLFATQNPPGAYGGRKARAQQTLHSVPLLYPPPRVQRMKTPL